MTPPGHQVTPSSPSSIAADAAAAAAAAALPAAATAVACSTLNMRVRARECKPYGGQCGGRAALMKANACRRRAEMVLNLCRVHELRAGRRVLCSANGYGNSIALWGTVLFALA